jgi:hypothetical protein
MDDEEIRVPHHGSIDGCLAGIDRAQHPRNPARVRNLEAIECPRIVRDLRDPEEPVKVGGELVTGRGSH